MKKIQDYLINNKIKNVLIIFPHPDDESFTTGGLILECHKNNIKTNLLCLTKGEFGYSKIQKGNMLAASRLHELNRSKEILKIHNLIVEDLPDGSLRDNDKRLHYIIAKYIDLLSPDLIVTYGPSGFTGHPDHIKCSSTVFDLCKLSRRRLLFYIAPKSTQYFFENPKRVNDPIPTFYLNNSCNYRKANAFFSHKSQLDNQGLFQKINLYLFLMFTKEQYYLVDYDNNNYKFEYGKFIFR